MLNILFCPIVADIAINDTTAENWTENAKTWFTSNDVPVFEASFDGDGHTGYGLYCNNTRFSGLVSMLTEGGNIHNLNLKNSYIRGYESAGGIVGYVYGHYTLSPATVSYCSVDNTVINKLLFIIPLIHNIII